jgi:hypothetical protein
VTNEPEIDRRADAGHLIANVAAAILMLAVGVPYGVSGLVVTEWIVITLAVIWLGLVVVGVRLARHHSYAVLAIPLVAAGIWLLVVYLADVLLGQTA